MRNFIVTYGLMAALGGLSVLAYAPFELWWLMPLCLACLYYHLTQSHSVKAAKQGFVFGLFQFGFGVSWVYVSLHTFGNMPPIMAGAAVIVFVGVIALYITLAAYVYAVLRLGKLYSVFNALAFASVWVLVEWLKGVLFTGFPWLDVGYTQTTRWLSGYAPIGGVYFVSFVTVFLACLLANGLIQLKAQRYRHAILPLSVLICVCYTGKLLLAKTWSEPVGKQYKIGLIQANIAIEEKWLHSFRTELVNRYHQLSPEEGVDLLVFPETAMPVYKHNVPQEFWSSFGSRHQGVLSGITELQQVNKKIYNSAVLNCGGQEQVYRKRHLVPFGEYLPLRPLFGWVLDYLEFPMSDFNAWQDSQHLECKGLDISLSICYEDAFSLEMAENVGHGGVLINISEDAWFGHSLAPYQRQQMAQMRAQEVARPMVRSSNTGPSTFISHQGKITHVSDIFKAQNLVAEVQPRQGRTFFVRWKYWPLWLCFVTCISIFIRKKSEKTA